AFRGRMAVEVEDQLVHAKFGEGVNIGSDFAWVAGEWPSRAVRRGNAAVVERRLVGNRQRCEITPLGRGQLLQGFEMGAHLLRRQRRGRDAPDRMPTVAVAGGANQRGARMPPDPDGWVRVLHREGFTADIGVAIEPTLEAGGRLRPELLENPDPFIGD